MAKLGRYSADRKKVKSITAGTSNTVTVANCGTIFSVAAGSATYLTLPSVADAGKGWWCKVVKNTAAGGGIITVYSSGGSSSGATAGEDILHGGASVGDTSSRAYAGTSGTAGDLVSIAAAATLGDWVEFWCDGTYMYWFGSSAIDAGIVAG